MQAPLTIRTCSIAAASALLIALLAWMLWPQPRPEIIRLQPDPSCDLRAGPCELRLDDGSRIRFGIQPRDIPVGKLLQLTVDIEGQEAQQVAVDINGVDMDMGLLPYPLEAKTPHHFEGPGGLNFCSRGIMEWEARVMVRRGNTEVIAPFRFITEAPDPALPTRVQDAASSPASE